MSPFNLESIWMVQVVWFKRDLRVDDHAPLADAARVGPVLPLLIVEPGLWRQPDMAGRHHGFMADSAATLRQALQDLGADLIVRRGEAVDVLAAIHARTPITRLWSHEETGSGWTFARDRAVRAWCRDQGVTWHERRQFGVVRPGNDRNRWAAQWERFMAEPLATMSSQITMADAGPAGEVPDAASLGLSPDPCPGRQIGGSAAAQGLLDSFLAGRGRAYHKQMSSPLTAAEACSRLSPHIAWGTLSLRTIVQRAYAERRHLADMPPAMRPVSLRALDAFIARLHWHCHFIQKLEDEPDIETRPFHSAFTDARPTADDDERLVAWTRGQTGWPFVDACMRALDQTGWINFRMRAMLIAVASYHLWLDWRKSGRVLARRFVDYEPGIHWAQVQMQSGTTAINTPRIYNPVKQSLDQDPDGTFIRKWVPELAPVPDEFIHTPWTMPASMQHSIGVRIGTHYPAPITDHEQAARIARRRLTEIRAMPGFRQEQLRILEKHGSRKGNRAFPAQDRPIAAQDQPQQLKLEL